MMWTALRDLLNRFCDHVDIKAAELTMSMQ
jgi:hypothetical protein